MGRDEKREQLMNKHDSIFRDRDKDMSRTAMCWGLSCGNGWLDLIDELCTKIESYSNGIVANQVKEKFGTLRFYYQGEKGCENYDIVSLLVDKYEMKSRRTCESCGQIGQMSYAGHWMKTLCGDCRDESENYEPGDEGPKDTSWVRSSMSRERYLDDVVDLFAYLVIEQDKQRNELLKQAINMKLAYKPLERLLNGIDSIRSGIDKVYSKPFKKLSSWCVKQRFKYTDNGISTDESEQTWRQYLFGKIRRFVGKFKRSWNPFSFHYKYGTSYEVKRFYNLSPDNDVPIGDIIGVELKKSFQVFGYEREITKEVGDCDGDT